MFLVLALPGWAQAADIDDILDTHILPGFEALADSTQALAEAECASPELASAYHRAFDDWTRVSHLRFGPTEVNNRAFALAFWPDPRGKVPKALTELLSDPALTSPERFSEVSIAGRGFFALEYLLFDPQFADRETCALVRAITRDIAENADAIHTGWQDYAPLMRSPGNDVYRSEDEVLRQIFTALTTGLEFTQSARVGRPLGSFDRPRPRRAEAWRSGRSLGHVVLSLEANRELAVLLSGENRQMVVLFDKALDRAAGLNDPVFAGVVEPQARLRIEVLQQDIAAILRKLSEDVGPELGIRAGFNALDGD